MMRWWLDNRYRIQVDWKRYLAPAVVLIVILVSAILGMRVTTRLVMLVGAAIAGVILFVWLSRQIEWGLLLLIPIAFFVPWGLGTGTYTEINLTIMWLVILLGVWVLDMLVIKRGIRLVPSKVTLPALLFVVCVGLAFLAGNLQWLPFATARASTFSQIGGVMMLCLPVGLMLLTGNVLHEEKWLRWMTWLFLGIGSLYLASSLIPGGEWITELFVGKSVSSLFFTWSVALSGGMLLFNDELKGWQRWAMAAVLGMNMAVSLGPARTSASSWVPVILVVGVLLALKWSRLGAILFVVGGAVLVLRYQEIYQFLFGAEEYSVITRAATWPIMYELVKASPLLGLGPSNYYFYTPLFSLMGYYVQFNSHNNFWDLAAQVGLVGLGLFLWMVFGLGWTAWKLRQRLSNGFRRGYTNGALAGLLGTLTAGMLADWFMPFVYNIGFDGFRGAMFAWLFLGGLIASEHFSRN